MFSILHFADQRLGRAASCVPLPILWSRVISYTEGYLAGKPTGKRPLGGPRNKWENNIRMDLKEVVISMRNLIDSAEDYWRALVNAALNLRVP